MNGDDTVATEIPAVNEPVKGHLMQRKGVDEEPADAHVIWVCLVCSQVRLH
jgi:hypothetical protein